MKKMEIENIKLNNSCEAPENSPASWCKKSDSRLQKCNRRFFARSGESEALPLKAKSGSFWRVGGAGWGVQPFCEKESKLSGENSGKIAESSLDSLDSANLSQGGLPRRFCESAHNDDACEIRARYNRAVLARSAFGMIFAVILTVIVAGLGVLGLKFSTQTLNTTTNEYIAIQLDLYMNSTTEIAILYVQRNGFVCNEGVDCDLGPNNISGQKLGVGKREPRAAIEKYIEYGDSGEYKFTFKITPLDNYDKYNANEYMQIDDIVECEAALVATPGTTQRCFREETKNAFILDIAGSVTNPLTNQTLRVTKRQVIKP